MDMTHITFFPQHVVIDTYSKFIWAVPQRNENVHVIIASLLQCFAVMECLLNLKQTMDLLIQVHCKEWNIVHITGLPYNPHGQAIVERAHRTFKTQLLKNKKGGTP
jgi:hypothetical protein